MRLDLKGRIAKIFNQVFVGVLVIPHGRAITAQ